MDQALGPANNSPDLASDPTDSRFVVMASRVDAPDFDCALQLSSDGGRTWLPARPVPNLPPGIDKCYAPEVDFMEDGTIYYVFVGLTAPGNEPAGVYFTTSNDRAFTFTAPRRILGKHNFAPRMAIDRAAGAKGRIHLVWLHATSDPPLGGFGPPPNPIMAAHSDDGGTTWSEPAQVSDPDRDLVVAPALALGSGGAVHVAYYDLKDDVRDYKGLEGDVWSDSWALLIASSPDGRSPFTQQIVDDAVVPDSRVMLIFTMPPPAMAASSDDSLCLAWTDARYGDSDALARCTDEGSGSWQPVTRLNDDREGSGHRQHLPQLSFSPSGRLDAIFYDSRRHADHNLVDVYYSYSFDEGAAFSPNHRLTNDPSDGRIGQQYVHPAAEGQVEFGSRSALLSRRDSVTAAWTDTRNSRQGTTGQDLFATQVVFPRADDIGTVGVVSKALVLAGAVAIILGLGCRVSLSSRSYRRERQ